MKKTEILQREEDHDRLTDILTYLLAGFEGATSGNKINSVTVQQAGVSGYRVITRGTGFDDQGNTVYLVGFTVADSPQRALLLTESGYRENLIQWKIDQFAKGLNDNGSSKDEQPRLVLTD